ncbi:MAG TPA: exodeoxyribonuclease V subunit gamma, partial [Gemmatimonadaceae bacterium]|nr:exodeoxyribonuclease V subunit gamma [Gemmatimonadaceae bacterium]
MPRLTLVTSDRPGTLIERLALDLGAAPLAPFDEDVVVVQSQGMERWIRLALAQRHGIAASLRMPFPAAFAQGLAAAMGGRPLDERFEREAMTWRILHLLEEGLADEPAFRALHALAGGGDTRARLGLASRLASRFDDYLLYRPDVLLAWEAGREGEGDAEPWQAALWRRLCPSDDADGPPMHLARWLDAAVRGIEAGEVARDALPPRVSVFGVSTLPPVFARLLHALARHVPVRAYLLAPPLHSWRADEPPRNPLFAAFGHASRELVALLAADADVEEHHAPAIADGTPTLLRQLQADVRLGIARGPDGDAPHPLDARDVSLTVHDCHSPMREMEVLRDQLFDAFAADPTLRPHDVLVMVPDVAAYAPFVDAVFGVGEPGLPRLPFHIADRPVAQESSVVDALLRLLRLVGARWTAMEIVELLDLPTVRRAAGIAEGATRGILGWVHETRICWGRDGAMRQERFNLPAVESNSWRAGLDRLLMGYATGRADALVAGIVPHAGDTIGDPETLGALARWTERLFDALDALREPRPLARWSGA